MCRQNVERMEGGEENEQRELKSPYIPSLSLCLHADVIAVEIA